MIIKFSFIINCNLQMIEEFRDFQFLQGFSFNAGFHLMMQFSSCVVKGRARDGTVLRFFVPVPLVPRDNHEGQPRENLRDWTGIPSLSRDNRPSLVYVSFQAIF